MATVKELVDGEVFKTVTLYYQHRPVRWIDESNYGDWAMVRFADDASKLGLPGVATVAWDSTSVTTQTWWLTVTGANLWTYYHAARHRLEESRCPPATAKTAIPDHPASKNMPAIYTIGYHSLRLHDLLTVIKSKNLRLIDVRFSPKSRNAAWRQEHLVKMLGERYVHVPEFGNVNYWNNEPIRLADPEKGYERVAPYLETGVCLLCVCQDVETCHRKVVAEYLAGKTRVDVVHWKPEDIRVVMPVQMCLF